MINIKMNSTTFATFPIVLLHILISCVIIISLNNYVETNLLIANTPTLSRGGILYKNHEMQNTTELFTGAWSLPKLLCEQIHKYGYDTNFIVSPAYLKEVPCEYTLLTMTMYTHERLLYSILMTCIISLLVLIFANLILCLINIPHNIQKWSLLLLIITNWVITTVQIFKSCDFIRNELIDPAPEIIQNVNYINIIIMYVVYTISCITIAACTLFNIYETNNRGYHAI